MPSDKKKPTPPKSRGYEAPVVFPVYVFSPLDLKEREEMRRMMATDVFKKVIRNTYAQKLSTAPQGTGVNVTTEHAMLIANNRLHQLQGWEMFEAAFFGQAEERVLRISTAPKEAYQSE